MIISLFVYFFQYHKSSLLDNSYSSFLQEAWQSICISYSLSVFRFYLERGQLKTVPPLHFHKSVKMRDQKESWYVAVLLPNTVICLWLMKISTAQYCIITEPCAMRQLCCCCFCASLLPAELFCFTVFKEMTVSLRDKGYLCCKSFCTNPLAR